MRKIKNFLAVALALTLAATATACGESEGNSSTAKKPKATSSGEEVLDTSKLESGNFYIYSAKKKDFLPLAYGQGTCEKGDTSGSGSTDRVMMFKAGPDYDAIPTFYTGDTLYYYTTEELVEEFSFERFKDLKYSIGLCNIEVTPTGRYRVKLKDEKKFYPGSDCDEMRTLNADTVIIDTLGGQPIRTKKDAEGEFSYLSEWGTITQLEKDMVYSAEVYTGTVKNDFSFMANVAMFGSCDAYKSADYTFREETLAKINIPEWFNTGYYLVGGIGFFRYVKGDSYDDNTNFNITNVNPDADNNGIHSIDTSQNEGANNQQLLNSENTDPSEVAQQAIHVSSPGRLNIQITFTYYDNTYHRLPVVTIQSPSGKTRQQFENDGESGLVCSFDATETGDYIITYYQLDGAEPTVTVY